MTLMNQEVIFEKTGPINEDSGSESSLSKQDENSSMDSQPTVSNNIHFKSTDCTGSSVSGQSPTSTDDQVIKMDGKLDSICNFLATLKLKMKEKLDASMTLQKFEMEIFPFESLTEIDELEEYLSNEKQRKCRTYFISSKYSSSNFDYWLCSL